MKFDTREDAINHFEFASEEDKALVEQCRNCGSFSVCEHDSEDGELSYDADTSGKPVCADCAAELDQPTTTAGKFELLYNEVRDLLRARVSAGKPTREVATLMHVFEAINDNDLKAMRQLL